MIKNLKIAKELIRRKTLENIKLLQERKSKDTQIKALLMELSVYENNFYSKQIGMDIIKNARLSQSVNEIVILEAEKVNTQEVESPGLRLSLQPKQVEYEY